LTQTLQEIKKNIENGAKDFEKEFQQRLRNIELLGKLAGVIRGSQDPSSRAKVLLNPELPETTTNLSPNQIDFISISLTICKWFPEFEGLEDFAREFLLASISKEGWGVDRVIQYEQAISEKRLVQLGLKSGEQGKAQAQTKGEQTK
jgi:hypothetical protein